MWRHQPPVDRGCPAHKSNDWESEWTRFQTLAKSRPSLKAHELRYSRAVCCRCTLSIMILLTPHSFHPLPALEGFGVPSPCPTQGGGSGYSSVTRARPHSAEPELARACFARRGSGLLSAPHMCGTAAGRGVFSSRSCMQCNVRRSAAHLVGAWLYVHHASHRVMLVYPPVPPLLCT